MIKQQKQMSMTSKDQDNTNLDIDLKLDSLIPKETMPKQKPKRIRTRPGKTPAIQINWTEEEESNIKFDQFCIFGFRSINYDTCGIFIA